MKEIIKAAVDRGASDLHIKSGDAFRARVHGKLVPLTKQALTPAVLSEVISQAHVIHGLRRSQPIAVS